MLQKLNERIQGIFAWVIIVLIAVTFSVFGVDYYQAHHLSDAEVTVNGEEITRADFDANFRRARQQRDPSSLSAAADRDLKKQVLDNLVVHKVMVQAALKAGFDVTTAQTNAAITAISHFQQDGLFSRDRYQQALNNALFTPETFQKEVKQGMLLKQQGFAFVGTSFALPSEIKRFVKLYMQTRNYAYLQIPARLFIEKNKVTDKQISDYYANHKQDFIAPETVKIQFVMLSVPLLKASISVNEAAIKKYYTDNQNMFLTPARWQVAHILFAVPENAPNQLRDQIKQNAEQAYQSLQTNPEQFTTWVKTMSADKLSIAANGVLPWIEAGKSDFDPVLSKLTAPGQIASPYKTSAGYEIFKLIDYKPAVVKPFEQVKTEVLDQVKLEKSQAKYADLLEKLSDISYQTPDSLQPVADELGLKVEESDIFSREGGKTLVTRNKQVINTAFSHDVLELGNNSEPIQLDNDTVIVLRVHKHFPSTQRVLEDVKTLIIDKLAVEQAALKAKKFGDRLLASPKNTEKEAQFIKTNGLIWKEIEKASRDTDKVDPMINDLAFSLPKASTQDGRRLVNGDYVVVRLKRIINGKYKTLDKEQQTSIAQQIEASHGLMEYDLYVNQLVKTAVIDRDGK